MTQCASGEAAPPPVVVFADEEDEMRVSGCCGDDRGGPRGGLRPGRSRFATKQRPSITEIFDRWVFSYRASGDRRADGERRSQGDPEADPRPYFFRRDSVSDLRLAESARGTRGGEGR